MIAGKRRSYKHRGTAADSPVLSHRAKKSLGQNFLIDPNISRKIVAALEVSPADHVVEIGPGKGALTRLLAATGANVSAVEKDAGLAEELRREFSSGIENVGIVTGDFLEHDLSLSPAGLKVFGNVPYNITSGIVSRLVDLRSKIDAAVLMVQDEVAARLSASPGTKDYGAISVRLQLVSKVEKLFAVPPSCFRPRPRVDSRVIRIVFLNRQPLDGEEDFVRFVKGAFGMRRKMFRQFVAKNYGKGALALLEERYKTGRVETFTPSELYGIFETLGNDARNK